MNDATSCMRHGLASWRSAQDPESRQRALEFLKKSCTLGSVGSCSFVAFATLRTSEDSAEQAKALGVLATNCNTHQHAFACMQYAEHFLNESPPDAVNIRSARSYQEAACTYGIAADGYIDGCIAAARAFAAGDGVPRDRSRALRNYSSACAVQARAPESKEKIEAIREACESVGAACENGQCTQEEFNASQRVLKAACQGRSEIACSPLKRLETEFQLAATRIAEEKRRGEKVRASRRTECREKAEFVQQLCMQVVPHANRPWDAGCTAGKNAFLERCESGVFGSTLCVSTANVMSLTAEQVAQQQGALETDRHRARIYSIVNEKVCDEMEGERY